MWAQNRLKGVLGELVAAAFYVGAGYRILAWRRRYRSLEVDLIVERGGRRVIVEVKTGSAGLWGRVPERMFTADKLKNLKKAMLFQVNGPGKSLEIELFVVDVSGFWPKLRRYPAVRLW